METERHIRDFQRMMELRNYSRQSIESYTSCLRRFFKFYIDLDHPKNINREQIELFLIEMGKISKPFQKQCHCSVQLFYREIIQQPHKMDGMKYPKWQKKISVPLDTEKVLQTIQSVGDKRHKAILALLYSTGLRREEASTLKLSDIDGRRMFITVHFGKGGKDRLVQLSQNLLDILRDYLRSLHYRPKVYLFENPNGRYISPDTILKVCQKYLGARSHQLRHTYATDLYRNGVDLKKIQIFLGHKDVRTTEIYLHVDEKMLRETYNPLDRLQKPEPLRLITKVA